MYIEKVISLCDSLYPNPYTKHEKLFWCDELSKTLFLKYNTQRETSELEGTGNIYLLPQNVHSSYVDKVIFADKTIKKQDFAEFGINITDTAKRGIISLPENSNYSRVYAVHITPYENIRTFTVADTISVSENVFFTSSSLIQKGDTLTITVNSDIYEDVFVFNCTGVTGGFNISFSGCELPEGTYTAEISRNITEQTVCPPPYDSMYIDYVLGNICYYQNDYESCNHHMSLYNSKLADYEKWLKCHAVTEHSDKKLVNWW